MKKLFKSFKDMCLLDKILVIIGLVFFVVSVVCGVAPVPGWLKTFSLIFIPVFYLVCLIYFGLKEKKEDKIDE